MADSTTRFPPAAWWGVLGVIALLGFAIWRLTPLALEPFQTGPADTQLIVTYALSLVFFGYTEGYRAFQKQFSPRVVVRALHIAAHPRWHHVLLAPAFCMGLLYATRRRIIVSWAVLLGVTGLVLIVRALPQPWRGVIDGGVVLGLSWGIVAIIVFYVRAVLGKEIEISPDLPK